MWGCRTRRWMRGVLTSVLGCAKDSQAVRRSSGWIFRSRCWSSGGAGHRLWRISFQRRSRWSCHRRCWCGLLCLWLWYAVIRVPALPLLPSRPGYPPWITRYLARFASLDEVEHRLCHPRVHADVKMGSPNIVPHLPNSRRKLSFRHLVLAHRNQDTDEDELNW